MIAENGQRPALSETLKQIAQVIGAPAGTNELLDLIHQQVSRAIGAEHFSILLARPGTDPPVLEIAYRNEQGKRVRHRKGEKPDKLAEYVFRTQKPLCLSRGLAVPGSEPGLDPRELTSQFYLGVPLMLGRSAIGVIAVQSDVREGPYSPDEAEFMTLLAGQTAIALENVRLHEAVDGHAREAAILYDIGHSLSLNLDRDSLLQQILAAMQESFGYPCCSIFLYDAEWSELYLRAARGYPPEALGKRAKLGSEESLPGWVAAHGEPLSVPDLARDGRFPPGLGDAGSELAVPLRVGGEISGVLDVESPEVGAFGEKDERLLNAFATWVAIALENARLYQTLEERVQELNLLALTTSRINTGISLGETLETIVEEVRQVIPYDTAVLYMTAPDPAQGAERLLPHIVRTHSQKVPREFLEELRTRPIPWGQGLIGYTAQTGEPMNSPYFRPEPRGLGLPGPTPELSLLAVPLVVEKKTIGVLALTKLGERCFADSDLRLLAVLADTAAIAIHKARLFDETQRLAIQDGLTGLANSRHFYQELKSELERAARYNQPASLILFDIDDFKLVNDLLGHQTGDDLLRRLAQLVLPLTRQSDLLARYGGEEFAILLPETVREYALATAERIRATIESQAFREAAELPGGRITISFGVAAFPADAANMYDLVRAADSALYAAKRAGKNRALAYHTLPPEAAFPPPDEPGEGH